MQGNPLDRLPLAKAIREAEKRRSRFVYLAVAESEALWAWIRALEERSVDLFLQQTGNGCWRQEIGKINSAREGHGTLEKVRELRKHARLSPSLRKVVGRSDKRPLMEVLRRAIHQAKKHQPFHDVKISQEVAKALFLRLERLEQSPEEFSRRQWEALLRGERT
jgi:hypothetical protein